MLEYAGFLWGRDRNSDSYKSSEATPGLHTLASRRKDISSL